MDRGPLRAWAPIVVLATASMVLALVDDLLVHIAVLSVLSFISWSVNERLLVSFLKALAIFTMFYAASTALIQYLILGSVGVGVILILSLKVVNVSFLAMLVIFKSSIHLLTRYGGPVAKPFLYALIAIRVSIGIVSDLSELRFTLAVNYGKQRGVLERLRMAWAVLKGIALVSTLKSLEYYEAMLPRIFMLEERRHSARP